MLKFLAILFIVAYVTFKFGGFLMKIMYSALGQDPNKKNVNNRSGRKSKGDINIDYVPGDKKKGNADFKGGEYVDYEELK